MQRVFRILPNGIKIIDQRICNYQFLITKHRILSLFAINYQFHMEFLIYLKYIPFRICDLFRINFQFYLKHVIYIEPIINSN